MTTISKVLLQAKKLEAVQTTQYTSVNAKTIIDLATVTNTTDPDTGDTATLTINIPASGTAVSGDNVIVNTMTIGPGETKLIPALLGRRFDAGDYLSTLSSDADALVMRLDGRQVTG